MDPVGRVRKIENILLVVIFLSAIALPMFKLFFGSDQETKVIEAREPAPRPPLVFELAKLKAFPAKFEAYFADHFGLRGPLLRIGNLLKTQWVGESPSSDVVIGEDGWLYYAGENTFDSFRGIRQLTSEELEAWRGALEFRRLWLAERGVHYYLALVPEKQTIYPEFVPARYTRTKNKTPLTQLVEYMAAHSSVDIIDLRQSVQAAKTNERVYWKTDTHWNQWGSFAAYQQILGTMEPSFPQLRAMGRSDVALVNRGPALGDLARIAGLNTKENRAELRPVAGRSSPPQPLAIKGIDVPEPFRPFATEIIGENSLPRAVMVHDSFAIALTPLLSENFARIVYLRRTLLYDPEFEKAVAATVESEHPEIFIEELGERHVVIVPDEKVLFGGISGIP